MSASQEERKTAKLDRAEESEQITDDDDLPELLTDSDTDLEDNKSVTKLPELGTGSEDNKPKPTPHRRGPRPARPHRELKPRELPELPTGKPPLAANQGSDKKPRRRFTQGIVTLREARKYQFRPVSPVDPSAPAAVDHF